MKYQIDIRYIEPVRVAYLHYKGVVTGANKFFPKVFQSIQGKTTGAPFFCFNSIHRETKMGDIDLCVPTDQNPTGNGIEVKELPVVKAICTTHKGSYNTMRMAYATIEQYANSHNLKLQLPFREVYIKGPGMILKGNPDKYITEILFPIREA